MNPSHRNPDWMRRGHGSFTFAPDPPARCFVMDGDGELAGFATASEEFSTWDAALYLHMDCLYLRESYRGQGLGRALMDAVVDYAAERDAVNIQWQTPHWNEGAVRFYERLGATAKPKFRFTLDRSCLREPSRTPSPGRHRPRPVRSIHAKSHAGWTVKRYEITLDGEEISSEVRSAADRLLCDHLDSLAAAPDPAVGFAILHQGEEAVWFLVDLWRGDILYQQMFRADLERPLELERSPADGPTGCVWELELVAHERDAYVRHVLEPADGPRDADYVADKGAAL